MERFFQKNTQEAETITDVINDDEQEQEQQSSIIISPSPPSLIHSNPSPMPSALLLTSPTTYSVHDQLLSPGSVVLNSLRKNKYQDYQSQSMINSTGCFFISRYLF
jgi:hypothetical protein